MRDARASLRRGGAESSSGAPAAAVPLAEKVDFLRRRDAYPESTRRVEVVETHMSWVFLTDAHAYKLKKPFHRGAMDYRTAVARRRSCARELRLNRRLAPEVYLGVVALTRETGGRLALEGGGPAIDWLVRMRRLPAALALEERLRDANVGPEDARRIVGRLVPFFAAARRAPWTPGAYRRRLASAVGAAAAELSRREFGLDAPRVAALADALRQRIDATRELLDARVRAGDIVEGHGDLRPEHIYLTDPPTIIDCIEFDRTLRLRDPVDELCFLAMEGERLGEPRLGEWLFVAYRDLAGDRPPDALLVVHRACNAFVRAKIAAWHLVDHACREPWTTLANDYLARTSRYLGA